MKFLELTWRVYIQHGLQGKMADYHFERAEKYKGDDSKVKKWRHHASKFMIWSEKWYDTQKRIDELKTYFTTKYEGLN